MLESDFSAPSDVMSAGVVGAADLPPILGLCCGWLICRSSRFRLKGPNLINTYKIPLLWTAQCIGLVMAMELQCEVTNCLHRYLVSIFSYKISDNSDMIRVDKFPRRQNVVIWNLKPQNIN